MNLFVIVGALLVIFAAAGRAFSGARSRKIDTVGRVLLGACGVAMLGASIVMFLGLRSAAARVPADLTAPSTGAPPPRTPFTGTPLPTESSAGAASSGALSPRPSPPPVAREARPIETRVVTSPETRVEWGCEESRTAVLSFPLTEGSRFVLAKFEILKIEKAKSYVRKGPSLDADGRTVSGEVVFQGLDRVFFNCPGRGYARLRLDVTVAAP